MQKSPLWALGKSGDFILCGIRAAGREVNKKRRSVFLGYQSILLTAGTAFYAWLSLAESRYVAVWTMPAAGDSEAEDNAL